MGRTGTCLPTTTELLVTRLLLGTRGTWARRGVVHVRDLHRGDGHRGHAGTPSDRRATVRASRGATVPSRPRTGSAWTARSSSTTTDRGSCSAMSSSSAATERCAQCRSRQTYEQKRVTPCACSASSEAEVGRSVGRDGEHCRSSGPTLRHRRPVPAPRCGGTTADALVELRRIGRHVGRRPLGDGNRARAVAPGRRTALGHRRRSRHALPDVRRRTPAGAALAERDAARTSGLPADRRDQRPVAASGQLQRRMTQPPSTLIVWPLIQSPALEQSRSNVPTRSSGGPDFLPGIPASSAVRIGESLGRLT